MKASETFLLKLLNGTDKRFIVPVYQRPYSWKISNCKQLLNDLKDMYLKNYTSHFFGSIVFLENHNGGASEFSIIDGQQRITTVCILLLAIRNYIKNNGIESSFINTEKITDAYLTDKFAVEEKKLKLKLVQGDDAAYDTLINNIEPTGNNIVIVNYQYFYNEISKLKIEEIEKLYDSITKLMIVGVSLALPDDDPQLIFESLNSTGLELEESDKIRNFVLMGLKEDEQNRVYKTYWEVLESTVGKNDLTQFFRHYIAVKLRYLPNADRLYFEFKKLKKSDETIDLFLQDIIKYAKYYQNIKNCDYYDDGYKGSIGRMLYLELGTVIPLLFDIYNAFNDNLLDNDDMNEALQIIESYYTRRKFCNFSTSSSNRTFISIGAEIDNYMDEMNVTYLDAIKHSILTRKGKSKFPTDNEFKENFGLYGLYNDKSEFKKYILERFENTNSRERVAVDEQVNNGDLTIEHVMPQTLSDDWKKELGDKWDEIFSKYLDTIGNLTLTAYNSDYSNNMFKFKKELPDKGFLCSKLFLNDYIKKCDKWGIVYYSGLY